MKIRVGIGFEAGRQRFQKVLKTNILNWNEYGLTETIHYSLNLFIAFDLNCSGTSPNDYQNVHAKLRDMVDGAWFIGNTLLREETGFVQRDGAISTEQSRLIFAMPSRERRSSRRWTIFCSLMTTITRCT